MPIQKVGAAGLQGGPLFSAYVASAQAFSANSTSKVNFATVEYDTASCYNTSLSRFTPNVAGYYQVNAMVRIVATSSEIALSLYKNGAGVRGGTDFTTGNVQNVLSTMVYLNGTTDYIELYLYTQNALSNSTGVTCNFQGYLVRPA